MIVWRKQREATKNDSRSIQDIIWAKEKRKRKRKQLKREYTKKPPKKQQHKIQKNSIQQKLKEKDELRSVEVVVVNNFTKDNKERSSDAEADTDDDDSKKDRVIGLRLNMCGVM